VKRAAVAAAAAAAVVAAVVLIAGGDETQPARGAAGEAATATATVERRDLVDRESIDGTLGYADAAPLVSGAQGTVTDLPEAGDVVRRGRSLYAIDGEPAAWLLYGSLPAWRDFAPGMDDGEDVRQLERNLRALGHDPDGDMTVDDEWTWATTAAVVRFQDERGLTEDGTLARSELSFRPGPARVGEVRAALGQAVAPGTEIAQLSTTRREVTVDLEATRQSLAREGDAVTVDLPNGRTARGRISDVAEVAEQPASEEADPTIEVTIALRGRAARGSGFDQAPVDVGFEADRRKDVLVVPVTALLARAGGGFAVEVVEDGRRRLVDVEPGAYAEDWVEVAGSDLREGMEVVVPE
jgi:peptidoglycan hydrolase-like protein with peptidoglycan-binding domain